MWPADALQTLKLRRLGRGPHNALMSTTLLTMIVLAAVLILIALLFLPKAKQPPNRPR